MSTGGPFNPPGRTGQTAQDDRGLLNKLKDAIKPLRSNDDENSPRNSAHRNGRDGGGSGSFKPVAEQPRAASGAAMEAKRPQQPAGGVKSGGAPSVVSATMHGFQPGITGGHGTQGLNP